MRLEEAKTIAERVKETLAPHCERIKIAGSIIRAKPVVHDIDIVLIEKPEAALIMNNLLFSMGIVKLTNTCLSLSVLLNLTSMPLIVWSIEMNSYFR